LRRVSAPQPLEGKSQATRARIADAALRLFKDQGYGETTIEHIAAAAGVGRRTVFHHFPTKSAMLFHHLRAPREAAIVRLRERPPSEPPLVSLHAVLRELCEHEYDRELLEQVRAVLALEPRLAGGDMSLRTAEFEREILTVLESRAGEPSPSFELKVLTLTAISWVMAAAHFSVIEGRQSLVEYFDEAVVRTVRELAALEATARF
jgi:AcrR family transcriptional regulator